MKQLAFLLLMLGWALGAFAEGTTCRRTTQAASPAPELALPTDDLIRDERNCAPDAVTPDAQADAAVVIAAPTKPKPQVAKPAAPRPHQPTLAKAPKQAKKSAWAWLTLLQAGLLGLFGLRRRLKAAMGGNIRLGLLVALAGLLVIILGAIVGIASNTAGGIIVFIGALILFVGLVIFIVGLVNGETI